MRDKGNFTGPMRLMAVILAVVWLAAGVLGVVVGLLFGEWMPAVLALLALLFGLIMVRVAQRGRLLPWHETFIFWRYK